MFTKLMKPVMTTLRKLSLKTKIYVGYLWGSFQQRNRCDTRTSDCATIGIAVLYDKRNEISPEQNPNSGI